jgi:hypothetical protein
MGRSHFSSRRLCTLVVASLGMLASLGAGCLRAQTSDELKARFLKEAPPAWELYMERAENLQGSVLVRSTKDGQPWSGSRTEFKSNKSCKLIFGESADGTRSDGEVRAFNSAYGFSLTRKAADAPWLLQDLVIGEGRYERKAWQARNFNYLSALWACTAIGYLHLADVVHQATFRVTAASAIRRDGADLVQIDFECPHTDRAPPYILIQRGSFVLDPAHLWVLRSFAVRDRNSQGEGTSKGDCELQASPGEFAILKRCVRVDSSEMKGGHTISTTLEYDLREGPGPAGDDAFSLSAFDLPEPQGIVLERGGSRWYLWFLGIGLASLAGGTYWLTRIRRRQMNSGPAPGVRVAQRVPGPTAGHRASKES